MADRLFVYGSLGPGQPNESYLTEIGGTWVPATVRGHLHEAGWGADIGYPGIELDQDAEEVQGHVFTSDQLEANWQVLDEFEGEEYVRVKTTARLNDMSAIDIYIYEIRKK